MVVVVAGKGNTVTLSGDDEMPLPQLFTPCAMTKPEEAVVLKLTRMLLVPVPLTMVAPAGKVQL